MLKQIPTKEINESTVDLIAKQWMLISAGEEKNHNTMTASWGGLGHLWNKDVAFIFVRDHRYTFEFTEKYDKFSLCFFEENYRSVLKLCGSKSGRDIDKMNLDINPVFEEGNVYYKEAKLVLLCNKIYFHDLAPENFIDPKISKNYPKKDYHRMYIGEIYKALVK